MQSTKDRWRKSKQTHAPDSSGVVAIFVHRVSLQSLTHDQRHDHSRNHLTSNQITKTIQQQQDCPGQQPWEPFAGCSSCTPLSMSPAAHQTHEQQSTVVMQKNKGSAWTACLQDETKGLCAMGTPTCRWGSLALGCKGLVRINISCRMVGETHAQNNRQVRSHI